MRVAFITESFLPTVNGVTNSVVQAIDHLTQAGHRCLVVAPGPGELAYRGTPVVRTASTRLGLYPSLPIGISALRLRSALRAFRPDVVHLASPAVLGAAGAIVARRLGIPIVAVYQTDLARFARHYRHQWAGPFVWGWLRRIHNLADLTLAPSRPAVWELQRRGIASVDRWGRGVDVELFRPDRASPWLRRRWAPRGETIVGFVGRLAAEKRVELLEQLHGVPGTRVVVVGDGPMRPHLQRRLPDAVFTGFLAGEDLARAYASMDVFVHTGTAETFCQTVQEALASGLAVIAPAAGGPMDLVEHGRNGWLWPADAPDLIRPMVEELARDPLVLAGMRRQARPSVEHNTWAALVAELTDHYRTVAGDGLSRGRAA